VTDTTPQRAPRLLILAIVGVAVAATATVLATVPLGSGPSASTLVVGSSPLLGRIAPEIDLEDLGGRRVRLSDYRGRPVLVNFWATWCIPCREEFGLLKAAREDHAADGLEILGVVHDDTRDGARAFAADMGAAWPMPFDADDVAWDDYGAVGLPTTFFVDGGGIVRAVSFGPLSAAGLAQQVRTILPTPVVSPAVRPS
jgi:cytochrome c biogenesis protein CcmG/thiol:disulfide interchange protein DsbE